VTTDVLADERPRTGRSSAVPGDYRGILVVDLLGGLGDLLMLLPALHALARAHPNAELHVLTHRPGDALLATDPAVTGVDAVGKGAEAAGVADALTRLRPDLVVSTTRHSGIPELVAAHGCRAVTDLWRRPPDDELVGLRYLDILRDEGLIGAVSAQDHHVHLTERERAETARGIRHAIGTARGPVVLVPASGMAVKQWPWPHWRALTAELTARGTPVLVCAEGPPPPIPGAVPLPPGTLREVAGWFAEIGRRGGVAVGGDTGPVRLAAAAGAGTVALFGPTSRHRYGLGATRTIDLQGLPGCPHRRPTAITEQVCWWTADCPLSAVPACMADIGVPTVLAAVRKLLAEN
jgi:ADP-heptose:LPS heptosyltransferase